MATQLERPTRHNGDSDDVGRSLLDELMTASQIAALPADATVDRRELRAARTTPEREGRPPPAGCPLGGRTRTRGAGGRQQRARIPRERIRTAPRAMSAPRSADPGNAHSLRWCGRDCSSSGGRGPSGHVRRPRELLVLPWVAIELPSWRSRRSSLCARLYRARSVSARQGRRSRAAGTRSGHSSGRNREVGLPRLRRGLGAGPHSL